jgi:hypothetical protein
LEKLQVVLASLPLEAGRGGLAQIRLPQKQQLEVTKEVRLQARERVQTSAHIGSQGIPTDSLGFQLAKMVVRQHLEQLGRFAFIG